MNNFDNFGEETEKEVSISQETENEISEPELVDEIIDDDADSKLNPVPKKSSGIKGLFEYVEIFCYALVLMIVLLLYVFRMVTVDGDSMRETLHHQDKLIISNLFYTPKTGDIVVINPESHTSEQAPIIKRVIATEGQTVYIDYANWKVYVDGVELDEPYVEAMRRQLQEDWGWDIPMADSDSDKYKSEFTVSEGKVFVMGDNRNNSRDSRSAMYGEMSVTRILGRVVFRVSPTVDIVE